MRLISLHLDFENIQLRGGACRFPIRTRVVLSGTRTRREAHTRQSGDILVLVALCAICFDARRSYGRAIRVLLVRHDTHITRLVRIGPHSLSGGQIARPA